MIEKAAEKLYGDMWLIRIFEERVEELIKSGDIHGTTHLYIGEEAVAVGAVAALGDDDIIVSNHRNHGHALAKTGNVDGMMAEMFGKSRGVCRGMGGSMHMAELSCGNYGSNGIVGAGIAIGAGIALAEKKKRSGKVVASFFGDGATNTGNFYETMNIAALNSLPIVFVCENNGYGISTKVENSSAETDMVKKAEAYGIKTWKADGNNVTDVRDVTKEAVEAARAGQGPCFVEAITYRWRGHSKSDKLVYREYGELDSWVDRCPIKQYGKRLMEHGATYDELIAIEGEKRKLVDRAVRRAMLDDAVTFEKARSFV